MTLDEARGHIGFGVLYCIATDEAQHAVIARVPGSWVFVRCSSDDRTKPAAPEDLALPAGRVMISRRLSGWPRCMPWRAWRKPSADSVTS